MARKVKIVCKRCGSDDVSCSASAKWDVPSQDWVLAGVHDGEHCNCCGGDADLIEQTITEEEASGLRPYVGLSIFDIEALITAHARDRKTLHSLRDEITRRSSHKAQRALKRVDAAILALPVGE